MFQVWGVDTYLEPDVLIIDDDALIIREGAVGIGTSNLASSFNVAGDVLVKGGFSFGGIAQMTPFFLEGIEFRKSSVPSADTQEGRIILGGELIADVDDRGLTLAVINKSDHSVVSVNAYDTLLSTANAASFVNAVDAMTSDQLGFIVSWDAYEPPNWRQTTNWEEVLTRVGLHQLLMAPGSNGPFDVGASRHSYAAVFEVAGISQTAKVVEVCQIGDNVDRPNARIGGFLMGGTFYAGNGQTASITSPQGDRVGLFGTSGTSGNPFLGAGRGISTNDRLNVQEHLLIENELTYENLDTDAAAIFKETHDFIFYVADNVEDEIVFGDDNFTTKRFRFRFDGDAYSDGWNTGGSDYAEWFVREEVTNPGDLVGINRLSGKARRYQAGDLFLGIHSSQPGLVGNSPMDVDQSNTHVLVGLSGQLEVDFSQVFIEQRRVYTLDREFIGLLLANNKVFIK